MDETCNEPTLPENVFRDQLAGDLRFMSLPPEAADWIRDNLRVSLDSELEQLRAARASLEKAIRQASEEQDTLLTLRLRGVVDDKTFEGRRAVIQDRKAHLQLQSEQPPQSAENLLERLDRVLDFAVRAPEVFLGGTRVQQRQIIDAVGSNFRVSGRKVLYEAKKPFSLMTERTAFPKWLALAEDLRTWLRECRDGWMPQLDSLRNDGIVPDIEPVV